MTGIRANVQRDIAEVSTLRFLWCHLSFPSALLCISDSVTLRTETAAGGDGEKAETLSTSYNRAIFCQYCCHYQIIFHNTKKKNIKGRPF